ncbi:hypothetical protein E4U53_007408 [Claviceps sorghi]|nr:hypothetical protein E4U53_007408 [Claviceps sorghi]
MAAQSLTLVEAVGSHNHQDGPDRPPSANIKGGLDDDDTWSPRVLDAAAERSLCCKFDLRLMPVLAIMYLFNALDKGNLSNAQTNGLGKGKKSPQLALGCIAPEGTTPVSTLD